MKRALWTRDPTVSLAAEANEAAEEAAEEEEEEAEEEEEEEEADREEEEEPAERVGVTAACACVCFKSRLRAAARAEERVEAAGGEKRAEAAAGAGDGKGDEEECEEEEEFKEFGDFDSSTGLREAACFCDFSGAIARGESVGSLCMSGLSQPSTSFFTYASVTEFSSSLVWLRGRSATR